ncbi:hypothetical protein [Taklimakanibacter deserti]|uniref:hypothetical protein n=1 Tax=Taklimakanibacter deserti TaxID=2267839 RepID=UPI0013C4F8A0
MSARAILGDKVGGPNYYVDEAVQSDGYVEIFTLVTKYGRFTIQGRALLVRRLDELRAIVAIERMSKSKAFVKALATSAIAPARLAVETVKNPVKTVKQTVSGVGAFFDRLGSGLRNAGSDDSDGLIEGALGASSAKRQIANELGVDPYTDFKPLATRLDQLAAATAAGGLLPQAAFTAIGGPAGTALSSTSSVEGVRVLVLDQTPAQLRDLNRARLTEMGVGKAAASRFLNNPLYTPTDKVALVAALRSLKGVENRSLYIDRAGQAKRRDAALFLVKRAELIAQYQRSTGGIVRFISLGGMPLNQLEDGRILAVMPFDRLVLTEEVSRTFATATEDMRKLERRPTGELRITGQVTKKARRKLRELGWTVAERGP